MNYNKLKYILIIPAFLFSMVLQSQDRAEADANFDADNFDVAREQYLKIWKRDAQDVVVNYRIAICYLKTDDDKSQALKYLEIAMNQKNYPFDTHYYYALALFHKHEFEKAKAKFEEYIKSKDALGELVEESKKYLVNCTNAEELIKSPLDVTFINLGKNINTKRSDFLPFVNFDETHLVFTSNKKYSYDYQMLISNVFHCDVVAGSWQPMKSLSSKINTDENELCVGYAKNGETLILTYDHFNAYFDIFYINKKAGTYKDVFSAGDVINTKYKEGGATMTFSGDTLIFASDRPGGFGGFDLYYSAKLPDGTFGIPINLGPGINTVADENYPSISYDSKNLYFASTGYNSMGGYDIFSCTRKGDKFAWSTPKNFGYPINDTYDNLNISFPDNKRFAYVASFREGGFGNLDIYKVVFNDQPRMDYLYTGTIKVQDTKQIPVLDFDKSITIEVFLEGNDNPFGQYLVNPNTGNYVISLPPGKYELKIKGEKIEDYIRPLEVTEVSAGENFTQMDVFLRPKVKTETTPKKRTF
ncbi:MAG: hypothetical protein A2W91_01295 [Bacteroidetes bacterium GWF2_38_335]|nr:MAG: hypothetical protein A2W91_01295 [Bacteroidetes bacterium GWF2_38_335]OFY80965.1 MAG: hypothetical protein A2281_12970 [Bacteroidetes bacterium RIFOXYA12_FULL_38_20]